MVLTEEQKTDMYPAATLEPSTITNESGYYGNLTNTQYAKPSWFSDPLYSTSTKVAQVKNAAGIQKIGPNIILKVMAGDSYNIRVASGWSGGSATNSSTNVLSDLLVALSNGASGLSGGKATSAQLQNAGSGLNTALSSFMSTQTTSGTKPKAYINWILLDEQFKVVMNSSGFEQVGASGATTIHTKTNLTISKSGYLYIYTSNEATNIDVFFDNLQVTHIRGPLISEDHYYPFGERMFNLCYNSLNFGSPENQKKKYQGYEYNTDFDINLYETFYRSHDPQIGRFWQIDPKLNEFESPYAAMGNNPILNGDILGDTIIVNAYIPIAGNSNSIQSYKWYNSSQGQGFHDSNGNLADLNSLVKTDSRNQFLKDVNSALGTLYLSESGKDMIDKITNLNDTRIDQSNNINSTNSGGGLIGWNPSLTTGGLDEKGNPSRPAFIGLAHELGHEYNNLTGKSLSSRQTWATRDDFGNPLPNQVNDDEISVTHFENKVRSAFSIPLRSYYSYDASGMPVQTTRLINTKTREALYVDRDENFYYSRMPKGTIPFKY